MTDGIKAMVEKVSNFYGLRPQMFQLIEEMAELTQAINKYNRWCGCGQRTEKTNKEIVDNIIEEIADVEVCLAEVKYLMHVDDDALDRIKKKKLQLVLGKVYRGWLRND